MELDSTVAILRDYQKKSLSKIFDSGGSGRARSGVIVLPCGAGKTLTGIACCNIIKKSCIVLCTGGVAVEQWIEQFKKFTTISEHCIKRFTANSKEASAEAPRPSLPVGTLSYTSRSGST